VRLTAAGLTGAWTTVLAAATPVPVPAALMWLASLVLPRLAPAPALAAGLPADGICVSSGSPLRRTASVSPRVARRRSRPSGRSRNGPGHLDAAPPRWRHRAGLNQSGLDQARADQSALDQTVLDRAASDRAASDRAVSDPVVSDRAVSDPVVSDPVVSDQTASDQTVPSGAALRERAKPTPRSPGRVLPGCAARRPPCPCHGSRSFCSCWRCLAAD
jgi:hypothetical protein